MQIFLLLTVFAAASYAAHTPSRHSPVSDDSFHPPRWYHGYDGPIFGVVEDHEGFERRTYHPTVWASTNFSDVGFDAAYNQGVKKLDSYWGGKNVPERRMADTVPTFMQMYPKANRKLKDDWTVEYFIPHELHEAPPAPSAESVNVIKLPQQDVWVKVFGGWAKEDDVKKQVFDFFEELDNAGINVRHDMVGVAFYDKPYHIISRHNEVWAWPKEEETASIEDVAAARHKLQENYEALLRKNMRG